MGNLIDLMKDVHQNAVEHGWWETPRPEYSVRALIVSEWAEALEEARAGRPMVWHECRDAGRPAGGPTICEHETDCPCKSDMDAVDCVARNEKPAGIAVELMDGCIRIMDYLGRLDCTNDAGFDMNCFPGTMESAIQRGRILLRGYPEAAKIEPGAVPVDMVVDILTDEVMKSRGGYGRMAYVHAFCVACAWVMEAGLDPEKLLLTKHRYNKGRPYKHGKRF